MRFIGRFPLVLVAAFGVAAWASVAVAEGYGTFADCLRQSGAVMYTASWCPVCKAQRKEFRGYANRLKTVECSVGGKKGKTRGTCESANINSYPTWVFADGSSAEGLLSTEVLAQRTGCAMPD